MYPKTKFTAFQPWIVLAAATGVNISMGLNYSWSVVQKALITQWHWSSIQASLPYTIYAITITLAMLFSGRLYSSIGPKKSIRIGAVLMGTGLISCSFSHHPLLTTAAYSIAGFGGGICYSTTLPTVIKWFPPEKKGFVTGIVVSGSGLAPIYVSFIANWLLNNYGISNTFLFLGLSVAPLLLVMGQFLNNPPLDHIPPAVTAGSSSSLPASQYSSNNIPWREMIQTPLFLKLWLMYLFMSSAGLMIIGHITIIAKTQAQWENGFYLVIVIAIANTCGRMAGGYFSDKYGRMTIIKGVFLLLTINLLSFVNYTAPLLLAGGAILLGFCYGTCPALFPLITADFFGTKNLAANYGVLFTAWGSAAVLGPILASAVIDLTGTYFIAYMISAFFLFAAFILALTIRPQAQLQEAL